MGYFRYLKDYSEILKFNIQNNRKTYKNKKSH